MCDNVVNIKYVQLQHYNMSSIKQFSQAEIAKIIENNADPKLGRRNAALVMGGLYWGLTALEMCQIKVKDVISPSGEFYQVWVLPKHASYNNESREIHTEDHVLSFFESYVLFRIKNNWGLSNLSSYKGLDPESCFFLNDNGKEYKLTGSDRGTGKISYQARSMNEQLKRMISKTDIQGATPASFRETFIKMMYEAGCQWEELKLVTGIKTKKTLENKVRPEVRELEQVYKTIFKGVKLPVFNDGLKS